MFWKSFPKSDFCGDMIAFISFRVARSSLLWCRAKTPFRIAKLGFEAVDAGPLRIARLLEAYGMLWIDQALNRGRGQNFAFALIDRERSE